MECSASWCGLLSAAELTVFSHTEFTAELTVFSHTELTAELTVFSHTELLPHIASPSAHSSRSEQQNM